MVCEESIFLPFLFFFLPSFSAPLHPSLENLSGQGPHLIIRG